MHTPNYLALRTHATSELRYMSKLFEELDYRPTPIGPIALRRRHILSLGLDVYEVILGDEHLMSSLFTASEIALADLGLAACDGIDLDVVVGGLGLGYTAQAVLKNNTVRSLKIVEYLDAVVDWHEEGIIPFNDELRTDPRCSFVRGDFFAMAAGDAGFNDAQPGQKYHAILIDIDHSPDWLLDQGSESFYTEQGFGQLARHLHPGGVMGLWSDAKPDPAFVEALQQVFVKAWAEPVTFTNPLQGNKPFTQTVYLARK